MKRLHTALRIKPGAKVDLRRRSTDATLGLKDKADGRARAAANGEQLADLSTLLAATGTHGLLIVFQGLDGAGKDSGIKHCIGPMDPMMVSTHGFGVPSSLERAHDFLWRVHDVVPPRGRIAAFNRSHYEDVLVVRVDDLVPETVWRPRYEQINAFEHQLVQSGILVLKFCLHISREEQAERLQARLDDPKKHWKFDEDDIRKHGQWDAYRTAYEEMLMRTSTEWAPWYLVPADRKWVRDVVVTDAVVETIESLGLEWPELDPALAGLRIG